MSVSTTFQVIENEITLHIGFIFLGCAGVFVGHPFDTVKVIQNILTFVLYGSRISFGLIIDQNKGKKQDNLLVEGTPPLLRVLRGGEGGCARCRLVLPVECQGPSWLVAPN